MAVIIKRYQGTVKETAANLASANRVYATGWLIIEIDTDKQKEADGVTAYNDLPYSTGNVQTRITALETSQATQDTAITGLEANKVDKVTGKSLVDDTLIPKMVALDDQATITANLAGKADLVGGKVNPAQMPDLSIFDNVDSVEETLADYIANEWTDGSIQKGDTVTITNADGTIEIWRLNVNNGSVAGDYQKIDQSKIALGNVIGAGALASQDTVTESQISDLDKYTQAQVNTLLTTYQTIASLTTIALIAGQKFYRFKRIVGTSEATTEALSLGTQESGWVNIHGQIYNNDSVDMIIPLPSGWRVTNGIADLSQATYATGSITLKAGGVLEYDIENDGTRIKLKFETDGGAAA